MIHKICFLCKNNDADSVEHVFPKWLQNKYELWDQRMKLKNGSLNQYKDIKIPCCKECNSKYLSKIEIQVRQWVENKQDIDKDTLFIWLFKIMYGLHYKELFLRKNIADKNSETIANPEDLFSSLSVNSFLHFALDKVRFVGFKPYTMYIFEIEDAKPLDFFYVDEPNRLYSCIQLGQIGVVCSFQDDGYIDKQIRLVNSMSDIYKVNKLKFAEISALVFDLTFRIIPLPNYKMLTKNGIRYFSIQPSELKNQFKNFEIEDFIKRLDQVFYPYFSDIEGIDEDGDRVINLHSQIAYI